MHARFTQSHPSTRSAGGARTRDNHVLRHLLVRRARLRLLLADAAEALAQDLELLHVQRHVALPAVAPDELNRLLLLLFPHLHGAKNAETLSS